MVRRLVGPLALLTAIGALAIAAVGFAAKAATSTSSAPRSAPAYMPAAGHSRGDCPNMGGDSGTGGSPTAPDDSGSGASQSEL